MEKAYVDVKEVASAFGISEGKGYAIIRELNAELKGKGFITVAGKLPRKFFEEKNYGYGEVAHDI